MEVFSGSNFMVAASVKSTQGPVLMISLREIALQKPSDLLTFATVLSAALVKMRLEKLLLMDRS